MTRAQDTTWPNGRSAEDTTGVALPAGEFLRRTPLGSSSRIFEADNFDHLFSSAQIMETANAIGTDDAEWMSQAMTDYNLW